MFVVISLGCILALLPHVLAYQRMFQSNDEDFAYDNFYDWLARKDQRNADIEAYLRQVLLQYSNRRNIQEQQHHPHHGVPPELHSLALQFQRQQQSDFAVPPSDSRFFDPPRPIHQTPPHLYYNREAGDLEPAASETVEEKEDMNADKERTTDKRSEGDELTTVPQALEEVYKKPLIDFSTTKENILLVAVVAGCSTAVVVSLALLIYGFLRLQRKAKDAADVEYPAYGVTGPNKEATPTGDRRLAHSAQMYHYQLTKQQIIAMESSNRGERRGSVSDADSEDDENEEGDYTVYECPGLAPTGEMEVKNPLFQDETTPASNDQTKE